MKKLSLLAVSTLFAIVVAGCDSDVPASASHPNPDAAKPIVKGKDSKTMGEAPAPVYNPAGKDMTRFDPGAAHKNGG